MLSEDPRIRHWTNCQLSTVSPVPFGRGQLGAPCAEFAAAARKRIGLKRSQSTLTRCSEIHSRISRAVIGVSRIPLRKCPAGGYPLLQRVGPSSLRLCHKQSRKIRAVTVKQNKPQNCHHHTWTDSTKIHQKMKRQDVHNHWTQQRQRQRHIATHQ